MSRNRTGRSAACLIVLAVSAALFSLPVAYASTGTPGSATMPMVFHNNYDAQARGAVDVGDLLNQFTGVLDGNDVAVENGTSNTKPNAMSVKVTAGMSSYVFKKYRTSYQRHSLNFSLMLGKGFKLAKEYVEVASTETGQGQSDLAELELEASGQLNLTFIDNYGHQHYAYSSALLKPGSSYTIKLKQTTSTVEGSLQLSVDSVQVAHVRNANLGTTGVALFNVGNVYAPKSDTVRGHLYYDDVLTRGNL